MIGYSGTDAPTPFILLANGVFMCLVMWLFAASDSDFVVVQTLLPQARLISALDNATVLECLRLLISFVRVFSSYLL